MDSGYIIGIIGLISNILGMIFTYIFFRKGKKDRKPMFAIESANFIHDFLTQFKGLNISYKNKKVSTLSGSRIAIWNAGKESIRKTDIVDGDPIRIVPEEGVEILDINEVKFINESNKCKCELVNNKIIIDFEYLDYHEGLALEILHTGKTSWSLKVLGTVIGAGKIKHALSTPYPKRKRKAQTISIIVFLLSTSVSFYVFGFDFAKSIFIINFVISSLLYGFMPMIITYNYHKSVKPSLQLGVRDDNELLVSPPFGDKKTMKNRDPDSEPYI